jgi:hypothetical protein
MTAVEWFAKELYEKFEMKGDGKVFDDLLEQAKKMDKKQPRKMPEYDLDDLANKYADVNGDYDEHYGHVGFKAGFQKAFELLTFKQQEQQEQ